MAKVIFLILGLCWASLTLASSSWLTQMIVQKENLTVLQENEPVKKNAFFNHHALVLFYASTCPHCHRFAPTLKAWAQQKGANVIALAFDNEPLVEFPEFKPATLDWVNAAFQGQAIHYPALFVVNERTRILYPVTIGALNTQELSLRMAVLMPKIIHYERGLTP